MGCVAGSLAGRARPHDGVQLVDEKDNLRNEGKGGGGEGEGEVRARPRGRGEGEGEVEVEVEGEAAARTWGRFFTSLSTPRILSSNSPWYLAPASRLGLVGGAVVRVGLLGGGVVVGYRSCM